MNYEESNNHHQTTYYVYDDANQLIESRIVQVDLEDIIVNYQYDLYGNKTTETTIQGKAESLLKYVYSEGKQLKTIESEEGNITYKYNKQGNVVSKTTNEQTETFEYTGFNQLSKITNNQGIETEYEYDGLGSRVSKTVYTDYEYIYRYFKPVVNSKDQIKETFNQQVEDMIEALGDFEDGSTCELLVEGKQDRIKRESYTYVSDITKENEQVLVETQNKKETSYYYGIDRAGKTEELLNKVKEEQYLYNGSSDVVQLVQGSSIRYYEYDDSGRSSLIEGYGYRSEYHESGYQYFRFRYLDIDSGRFMSKDSYLGNVDPVSQNRYTYVGNNSINYSDPTGHWWNPLKAIKDGFDAVVDVGAKVVDGIVDVGTQIVNGIVDIGTKVANGVKKVASAVSDFAVDTYDAVTGKNRVVPEITANNDYNQTIIDVAQSTGDIKSLQEEISEQLGLGATPEEIKELIRKYCEKYDLDVLQYGDYLYDLTTQTYENQQAAIWNSQNAWERIQSSFNNTIDKGVAGIKQIANAGKVVVESIVDVASGIEKGIANIAQGAFEFALEHKEIVSAVLMAGSVMAAVLLFVPSGGTSLAIPGLAFATTSVGTTTIVVVTTTVAVSAEAIAIVAGALTTFTVMKMTQGSDSSSNSSNSDSNTAVESTNNSSDINGENIEFGSDVKSSTKLDNQMNNRGWPVDSVKETVNNPYTTRASTNLATGNSATVFYNQNGAHVIIDNVTHEVVQVSDALNPKNGFLTRTLLSRIFQNRGVKLFEFI